jgi:transcriptional regulator with XRE-family HTH domain
VYFIGILPIYYYVFGVLFVELQNRLLVSIMSIAKNIRNARSAAGFSQAYVSKKLGVSQQTYSLIENDPGKMSLQRLIQLCRILKLNAVWVVEQYEQECLNNGKAEVADIESRLKESLNRELLTLQISLTRIKSKIENLDSYKEE